MVNSYSILNQSLEVSDIFPIFVADLVTKNN